MAVIRAQQTGVGRKWQVIVRKGGHSLSRVFWKQEKAKDWARQVEDAIAGATTAKPFDRAAWLREVEPEPVETPVDDGTPRLSWTLAQALERYREMVTPTKKGAVQERKRIAQWLSRGVAGVRLEALTTDNVQAHVDARTGQGRAAPTIRNEVLLLSAVYRHAINKWKLPLTNPVAGTDLPSLPDGRKRRLEDAHEDGAEDDETRILAACREAGSDVLADLAGLAIETGMRQSEMLSLTKENVKKVRGRTSVELADSKSGSPRYVIASAKAASILRARAEAVQDGARLFPLSTDTLRHQWARARAKAGLPGLRFHDLRHEGVSRMADRGLTIGELQAQSGHRTAQILLRYVNARASDIARKLG